MGTGWTLSERGRAAEYITKAFQLREHASEREKLLITGVYYSSVTGELDKAAQTFQEVIKSYPREGPPYDSLGGVYAQLGQYEKAVEMARQSMALAPGSATATYSNLANYVLALQHFDEARHIIHVALARKLDDRIAHNALYALAFLGADSTAMAEQQQWFQSKPEYENVWLALASDTEAYAGHLGKARELTKQSVGSAIRAGDKESGAIWQENAALREAAYGNAAEARASAAEALKLAPGSQGAEAEAALAFAMAGDTARAESLAQDLEKRYPLDTQTQSLWLPAIQAQLALDRRDSTSRPECSASCFIDRVGADHVPHQHSPAYIRCMYAETPTWQPDRAVPPPLSFRRFSTTAASFGTAGRERWRIWAWHVPMPCRRKPRRERMPTSPIRAPLPATKFSSPSGKTPTPTSLSCGKPGPSTQSCSDSSSRRRRTGLPGWWGGGGRLAVTFGGWAASKEGLFPSLGIARNSVGRR